MAESLYGGKIDLATKTGNIRLSSSGGRRHIGLHVDYIINITLRLQLE